MATSEAAKTTVEAAGERVRGLLGSALFFSVFTNLLMLTGPLFMLQIYDRVLGSRSEETLVALFGLVALLYLFYGLLEFARSRVMARVGARVQSALSGRVMDAVLELSALRPKEAKKVAPVQDLDALRTFFASPVALALMDLPWTPIFLIAIFIFHPILGWLALGGAAILVVTALLNQITTRKKTLAAAQKSAQAARFSRDAENGAEYIWSQGMAGAIRARWEALQADALGESTGAADWSGSFTSFSKATRFFLQSAILAVGAYLVLQNQMTAGAMIAASILLGRALAPVEQSIGSWALVQRARQARTALGTLLEAVPERARQTALPQPEATLSVQNLTVIARRGDPPILRGVSFDLAPGQALGVIGKSGSGKTTLARVLSGTVAPSGGEVRLGGATLDQFGPDLGKHLGYLPQDVSFFDATVAENIAQMATDPDPQKVVAAAQKARVHDVVLKLPKGYDAVINGSEARLSGGQMQRLALARALYNDPVLLVLDEPNSALDAEGSDALNKVVLDMKAAGKAVIIMTHRPTAISCCDTLLVLDNGARAAFGPRDEIIRSMMKNAGDVQKVVQAKPGGQS